jgi:hypothetical protein
MGYKNEKLSKTKKKALLSSSTTKTTTTTTTNPGIKFAHSLRLQRCFILNYEENGLFLLNKMGLNLGKFNRNAMQCQG